MLAPSALLRSCSAQPVSPSNVSAIIACIEDVKFHESAINCLESLSYSNCNDGLLGDVLPIMCNMLLSGRAAPSTALVLRVICNMVANDCNDIRALECGLVRCMLQFISQQDEELQGAADMRCLALRVLSSLSSSPSFDSVFCSSGMTQVPQTLPSRALHISLPTGTLPLLSRGREGVLRAGRSHAAQHEHPQRVCPQNIFLLNCALCNNQFTFFFPLSNHSQLLPVLSAAVEYIKRLLAVHSLPWASRPVDLLPPADRSPLPTSASVKLNQRGDHVIITEDVAIAVQNMSCLLMHASQQPLRSSCVSVMHSAPLFFSPLDSKPESPSATCAAMPHALSALAFLYPPEAIERLLQPFNAGPSAAAVVDTAAACAEQWQVGALCTAKCPADGKFRVGKVVQVNARSVRVQFTLPDHSTVSATTQPKFLRALKSGPKGVEDGCSYQTAQAKATSKHAAAAVSSLAASVVDEDLLSLCSLSLLPFVFQDNALYPSLLAMLLQLSAHERGQQRALIAINSLCSNPNFVQHMCATTPGWISAIGPIANLLSNEPSCPLYHSVLSTTVVSIFDSLLRSAVSADQRRVLIDSFVGAGIVRALFQFCRGAWHGDAASATRDTAACVVLSCAAVSPGPIAISWLKSSFQAARRASSHRTSAAGSNHLLQDIADAWAAARVAAEADYGDDRCVLAVERYNLVASSVKSFGFCPLQGLARKLKVNFVLERGCDAGGLTVEWLHLLLDTVFSDFAFFLPVLLPSGRPSGAVRINHSAAAATSLPANEVFRMVGCCLALCLQVRNRARRGRTRFREL